MPMDRSKYPPEWYALSLLIRFRRARGWCECDGECGKHAGRCDRRQGMALPSGRGKVVLTVAHLWRGPCADHHAAKVKCGEPDHLKAMCQRCHLAYDLPQHRENAARTRRQRRRERASGDLFGC